MPERLFDDHAPPGVAVRFGQTAVGELLRHEREVTGRNRHVEGMVAACATVLVEFGHRIAQALECIGILEGAMHETYALCKLVPGDLVEMRAAMLLHIFLDKLTEMILRPITPCETGETEARWQQAPVREIVDRRQQFLASQIARDAEDHDRTWPGDAGKPQISWVAQRIDPGRVPGSVRCVFSHSVHSNTWAGERGLACSAHRYTHVPALCKRMANMHAVHDGWRLLTAFLGTLIAADCIAYS